MVEILATDDNAIYKKLPGLEVPVGNALTSLSNMWEAPADSAGSRPPSEFRASRMNLVVHFGFDASTDEATEVFQSVLAFSRRYPCRVIALCPSRDENATGQGIVCKIFSECYIGEKRDDMSCCEAVIFGYTLKEKRFLEDQISIFLESDLPTYYWPYRFDCPRNLSSYQKFFKESTRILVDSSKESFIADQIDLPDPSKLHDLAFARLLSIRQCVGQFLSSFPVDCITDDLEQIMLTTPPELKAEGRVLLTWIGSALKDCLEQTGKLDGHIEFDHHVIESGDSPPRFVFVYGNDSFLECVLDIDANVAQIVANLGGEEHSMTAAIRILSPDEAMAEALFFG